MRRLLHVTRFLLLVLVACASGCGKDDPAPAQPAVGYALDGGLPAGTALPVAEARRNVLLIVIDTLRADELALDAPDGGDMPALARRARQGGAFANASSASSWTLPSIASMLTGRLPSGHRITGEEGMSSGLANVATLAEVLGRGLGYETLAWVGEAWASGPGSMFEGFDVVVPNASLQAAPRMLRHWKQRRTSPARPWFLLLHTYEAHDPYGAANHPFPDLAPQGDEVERARTELGPSPSPAEVARKYILDRAARDVIQRDSGAGGLHQAFSRYIWRGHGESRNVELEQEMRAKYREGVRWVDGLLEGVLVDLDRVGMLKNTVVIVTGDHGEAFGEHGMLLHGRRLDDELLRVPLVMLGLPGIDAATVARESVNLIDLMPTLLDVLALPPMEGLPGRSLIPVLKGSEGGRAATAQVRRGPRHTAGERDDLLESVRNDTWKFVITLDQRTGAVVEEAFDLRTDAAEKQNLAKDGRAEGLAWDPDFCNQMERARDRIWAARAAIEHLPASTASAPAPARSRPCAPAGPAR